MSIGILTVILLKTDRVSASSSAFFCVSCLGGGNGKGMSIIGLSFVFLDHDLGDLGQPGDFGKVDPCCGSKYSSCKSYKFVSNLMGGSSLRCSTIFSISASLSGIASPLLRFIA